MPQPVRARDVVAFGREVGRVLSDGRIVGRAEPFAKVFASSRHVKRAVGATAWVILEDIALDATIDDRGRLVAETSVRQLAANLGLNKTTVTRHVARLRDHGFVLHEETRDDASGRWDASRYVLDPSACVERFTHTPAAEPPPSPSSVELDEPIDRADGTVSVFTGHGGAPDTEKPTDSLCIDMLLKKNSVQQPSTATRRPSRRWPGGCAPPASPPLSPTAWSPGSRRSGSRMRWMCCPPDAVRMPPAGLCGRSATAGSCTTRPNGSAPPAPRAQQRDAGARALQAHQEQRDRRLAGWTATVGEALTDTQVTAAVQRITRPVAGLDRRSAPVAVSQLLAWAITTATAAPDTPLEVALTHALHDHAGEPDAAVLELAEAIPPAPATNADADPEAFRRRVRHAINDLEAQRAPRQPKLQGDTDAP